MLAVDFYLTHPGVVRSMVLLSPALNATRWTQDCERLISQLPAELRAIHANPDAAEEDVDRLNSEFMSRHFLRLRDEPESVKRAKEGFGLQVYLTMWGPNEFTPTGVLKEYDRTDDLPGIKVPALYLSGRYDSATPESTRFYASLTPGADTKVFENSAHHAFLEDSESFMATVGQFLASH
jgi:proline iminopeptidase